MQKYSVSHRCVCLWTYLGHVLESRLCFKPCNNTVYPVGVGLFGHVLEVSWEVCFVLKTMKIQCIISLCVPLEPSWKCLGKQVLSLNTVYPIGVKLFGHILWVSRGVRFVAKPC